MTDSLTKTARDIMAQPKSKWVALVDAWPESEREPIKERIRLIHRGEYAETQKHKESVSRTCSFNVKLAHKKGYIPMIIPDGATQADAWKAAEDRFFNYEILEVVAE